MALFDGIHTASFYLTYEEWKQVKHTHAKIEMYSFYLTYEEWKPL